MRTIVNPGRLLVIEGSFELLAPGQSFRADLVRDRESHRELWLDELLHNFLEDPEETVTGPIRITIEAAS